MTAARAGEEALVLHEDRYFGPEPSVRRVARLLYDEVRAPPRLAARARGRAAAGRGRAVPRAHGAARHAGPLPAPDALVLFTLDEATYARELAPLAGHYPAVRLGPPWWFHDSLEGMRRFRERVTETAGIYNTAGFNDDTRAFCSIPARHDLARRADANWLAGLVARHVVELSDAREMARALAVELAREAYKLGGYAGAAGPPR